MGHQHLVVASKVALAFVAGVEHGVQMFMGPNAAQNLGTVDPPSACHIHELSAVAVGTAGRNLEQQVWHMRRDGFYIEAVGMHSSL